MGSLNLEAKPAKAECGSIDRFSGLNTPPVSALTVSLCSQSFGGAVKYTQRIGTWAFKAMFNQTARVSISALVLSVVIPQND